MTNPFLDLVREKSAFSFDSHLDFIVRHVVEDNFDAVYLITAYPGFGKSDLAIVIAREISKRTHQDFSVKPVDPEGGGGNIVYPGQTYHTIQGGLQYLGPGSVVVVDEGVNQGYKRNSMTSGQKATMAFMDEVRSEKHFFLWLYRHRTVADTALRNGRALYLANVKTVPEHDESGRMRMKRGQFDFYWHEKLGNMDPFSETFWFDHVEGIPYPSLEGEPEWDEYNYYKRMFTRMAWVDWQAPWKDFPYEPGAQVPKVEEMIPYAFRSEEDLDKKMNRLIAGAKQIKKAAHRDRKDPMDRSGSEDPWKDQGP